MVKSTSIATGKAQSIPSLLQLLGSPIFRVVILTNAALFLPFLGRPNLGMVRWIVFVLLVLYVIATRTRATGRGAKYLRGFTTMFLIMALIRLVSTLWSIDPVYTMMRGVSLFAAGILICYLVGELRTHKHLVILNYALVGWLFFLFVPGLLLFSVGIKTTPFSDFEMERGMHARYSGILGNPNQIAICAAVLSPLVIASWFQTKKTWLIGLYLVVIISVYLSGSRSGLITQIMALICVPALASRKMTVGMWVSLGLAFTLLNPIVLEEAKDFFTRGKGESVEEISSNRMARWELGVDSIKKRPILGQGYGIGGVPDSGAKATGVDRGYALHNSYLQAVQENGVLGMIPVILIMTMVSKTTISKGISQGREVRYLHAGFSSAFICGCGSAFFESWLVSVGNLGTLPFWLCAAVTVHLSFNRLASPRKKLREKRSRKSTFSHHG